MTETARFSNRNREECGMFTHGRQQVDLNGTWKFCPDPMQRCRRQKWWKTPPREDALFPCWDPDGLWDIRVPGTWKTQFPELKWYDGHAVYVKTFALDDIPADREAFLVFDGVVYDAEVYLNGQLAGHHRWGYSAFAYRVTEMLMAQNRLFVLVENLLKSDRVPGEIFDWNNDGGIVNPVKLVFVPRVYVENFRVQTKLEGDRVVVDCTVELQSRDACASRAVTVRFPGLNWERTETVEAGEACRFAFEAPRGAVALWRPGSPVLHEVQIATDDETVRDEVGLREVRTEAGRILLNGTPTRLYGVCTHAEFKGTGRSATAEGIEQMVAAFRELGVNFVRCAHYPYSEAFGRAMDRAGLMWWEEVPAYWLRNMDDAGQTARACGMLEETVRRDWNRASVIVWSVSNECCYRNPENLDDNNYAYWFAAVSLVRRLDPSRLISCAEAGNVMSVKPVWDPAQGDEFKRSLEEADRWRPGHAEEWYRLFDVLAANMYYQKEGEAGRAYRRYVELFSVYGKPLMLSEFGSMSLLDAGVDAQQLGSEAHHVRVLREAYEVFKGLPGIVGYTPWCLTDIRVPIHWRWYNQGKAVFRYGLLDEEWKRKRAFAAVQESIAALRRHFGDDGDFAEPRGE